ncbi:MAG: hypothetical protein ACFB14_23915 [Leptolyngbyaceae cyanobacterium]
MTGFEPLIGAATAGLAGLISGLVKEKGGDVLKRLDLDIGKNIAFKTALSKYVQRYIDRHGTLKVLCVRMDNPIKLDEIYTAVQLLDRWALRYYESTESLQKLFLISSQRNLSLFQTNKQIGIQVANEQQYLMVLGGPGVGKSTFLRKVGLEALRALGRKTFAPSAHSNKLVPQQVYYKHPRIPVMLELRQFSQSNLSIESKIAEELETCGFPKAKELTEFLLKNGKLLVLLDGLDEVPSSSFNHVITEIEKLVDRYGSNRFIASCRVAAYTFGGFERFKDVAMATFDDIQIKHFINNWFCKTIDFETNTAKHCWELLSSKDYQAAKELAQTPLLLTLLCVVYDEYQDFPKKRHALYGEALDVLLRKWTSEKRVQRAPIYQELSTELELYLLSEIAYTSFIDDQLFFSKTILIKQIREFLVQNLNVPKHLNAEQILKEIEIQQGILVERARDTYSFSHLTFQEYLTAKYIVDNQKIDTLIRNHITDERWREVFLLVAGLATGKQGTDQLLLSMEKQAQTYLNNKELIALIDWGTKIVETFPNHIQPSAIRSYALAIALDRALSSTLSGALSNENTLNQVLGRALVIASDLDLDRASKSAREIIDVLVNFNERDFDHTNTSDNGTKNTSDNASNFVDVSNNNAKDKVSNNNLIRKDAGEILNAAASTSDVVSANASANALELAFALDHELVGNIASILSQDLINNLASSSGILLDDNGAFDDSDSANYFYVLELIVRCKEAAVRISPEVWHGIESRMVTISTSKTL